MKWLTLLYVFEKIFHINIYEDGESIVFRSKNYGLTWDLANEKIYFNLLWKMEKLEKMWFIFLKKAISEKNLSQENFFQFFQNRSVNYYFFDYIDYTKEFIINFPNCNYRCSFCETHNKFKKRYNFAYEEIIEVFYLIVKIKKEIVSVDFFGWEPTIDKDFFRFVDFFAWVKQKYWIQYINVATNAFLLSDKKFSSRLKWKIDCFRISFHSHDKKYFEDITKIPNSFERVCQGIENVVDDWHLVIVNMVLTKENIGSIIPTIVFLKKISPKLYIKLSGMVVSDDNFEEIHNIIPTLKETYYFLYKILLPFLLKHDIQLQLEKFPFCLIADFYNILQSEYFPEFWWERVIDGLCNACYKKNNCSRYHVNHKKYLEIRNEWGYFDIIRKKFLKNENHRFIHNKTL